MHVTHKSLYLECYKIFMSHDSIKQIATHNWEWFCTLNVALWCSLLWWHGCCKYDNRMDVFLIARPCLELPTNRGFARWQYTPIRAWFCYTSWLPICTAWYREKQQKMLELLISFMEGFNIAIECVCCNSYHTVSWFKLNISCCVF